MTCRYQLQSNQASNQAGADNSNFHCARIFLSVIFKYFQISSMQEGTPPKKRLALPTRAAPIPIQKKYLRIFIFPGTDTGIQTLNKIGRYAQTMTTIKFNYR